MTTAQHIVMHFDSPTWLGSEDDDEPLEAHEFLDALMRARQARLERGLEAAADRARMAAPNREDPVDWSALLADTWGDEPDERGEIVSSQPPQPVGYVYKLLINLERLVVAATEEIEKEAQLAVVDNRKDIDLLWIPSTYLNPVSISMRVVAKRSLLGHFKLIRSIPVAGWSRPPKWI